MKKKHSHLWGPWVASRDRIEKGRTVFVYERGCHCGAVQQAKEVKAVGHPTMISLGLS